MSKEQAASAEGPRYISRTMFYGYLAMLTVSVFVAVLSFLNLEFDDVALAAMAAFILTETLFFERRRVDFPPLLMAFLMSVVVLLLVGRRFEDLEFVALPTKALYGVFLGLAGLIVTYTLLKSVPGIRNESPRLVAFVSASVGVTLFMALETLSYYLCVLFGSTPESMSDTMVEFLLVSLGISAVSVLFVMNRHSGLLKHTVDSFLKNSPGTIDTPEYEAEEIKRAIDRGESIKVEFKSTLRTNLATGEKDPRMEKAVLKTIVAFLNSDGGTLLIGISDDGTVIGVDEGSFDSRDRLNLHLTNLIASQIGNEHLNSISFRLTDYQGKGVLRVVCRRSDIPAFLSDGKQDAFFVRSGPSSVELTGADLLGYASSRFNTKKGRS